jgi:succinyl-diaminopimelate desuccinylase
MSPTLDLAKQLIERPSVTPYDAGCQPLLASRLERLGFNIEPMRFAEVDNLWARRGDQSPLLVFAGHTDVVPTGPENAWRYPPFTPTIDGDVLYGRGAADMKSSIAAMITACERFLGNHPQPKGSIAFLITSDEEGPSINGTVKVVEQLQQRGETIDWCLVGEPSSSNQVGDVIKNGRRGSLNGVLTVKGVQGHVAYPQLADNPIHRFAPAMAQLCAEKWDDGNDFFPPTSFQISNVRAGTGANNVIPAEAEVVFNFRFSTEVTAEQLQQRVEGILQQHNLDYAIDWQLSGQPFLTGEGALIDATRAAVSEVCGYETQLSTAGGTSDGRFIAPAGAQVVELGPLNASIHKIDEHVSITDLDKLSEIYEAILKRLLT